MAVRSVSPSLPFDPLSISVNKKRVSPESSSPKSVNNLQGYSEEESEEGEEDYSEEDDEYDSEEWEDKSLRDHWGVYTAEKGEVEERNAYIAAMDSSAGEAYSKLKKVSWNPVLDKYLIKLMVEQARNNGRDGMGFRNDAWCKIFTCFSSEMRIECELPDLKNRLKLFRKCYRDVKTLTEKRGFSWDPDKRVVVADDQQWNKLIKKNKAAGPFRDKELPYYKNVDILFDPFFKLGTFAMACGGGSVG